MTEVVNFRDVREHWNAETQTWDDPKYVYIGRANWRYRLPQSMWANPYSMTTEADREKVIHQYRDGLLSDTWRKIVDTNIEWLRGKTLVCWCAPKACHGHVLLELLGEAEAQS